MYWVIKITHTKFHLITRKRSLTIAKIPPAVHNWHTSRKNRLRGAMLERPPRACATDLGPETLHVPTMGPNEHKSRLAQVLGPSSLRPPRGVTRRV